MNGSILTGWFRRSRFLELFLELKGSQNGSGWMNLYLYLKHFPAQGNPAHEGTSKAVHGLASGLASCGVRVTILCEGPTSGCTQTEAGYQIRCFASPNTHPSLTLSAALKHYIKHHIYAEDLVILNGIFHLSVYAMSRCLVRSRIPYVVAPHDPYHPAIFGTKSFLKWTYWYLIERRVLSQSKAVQVLDRRHGEWLRQLGIATAIVEVPNGFSPQDVHPEETLNWPSDRPPRLFFLGRLDAYNKGLDILLDAFAQIAQVSDATLELQGPDWGDRASLQKQSSQLGIGDRVTFLEADYQNSPAALMGDRDVFCLTSRFEGFSLSALESMLAGRVLLVSEVAGIAPHVQSSGCGVVVAPEIQAIKAGFLQLFQRRSEWQDLGLRGRRYALEYLQWNTIAACALEQYQACGFSVPQISAKASPSACQG
jgi:glycosyltransferase involved in cell wall biosynthesis